MKLVMFMFVCLQRGSDEMVTSPGVEGAPVSNGDTMGTNHVDNNNDAKKVRNDDNLFILIIPFSEVYGQSSNRSNTMYTIYIYTYNMLQH